MAPAVSGSMLLLEVKEVDSFLTGTAMIAHGLPRTGAGPRKKNLFVVEVSPRCPAGVALTSRPGWKG